MPREETNKRSKRRSQGGARSAKARTRRLRGMPPGAAAAERASAGMGTQDVEPADWLFGDSLRSGDS